MAKLLLYFIALLLLGGAVFFALSNKQDAVVETGTIDQMTDKAAREMVEQIRTPMEKASDLKKMEQDRMQKMEEDFKKQLD